LESFHVVLLNPSVGNSGVEANQNWQLLDYLTQYCPRTKLIAISGKLSAAEVAKLFMGYPIRGYVDKNAFDKGALLSMIERQISRLTLRVQTLGDFRVWRDGRQITHFGGPEADLVLKLLITRRGTAVSVDELLHCLAPLGSAARNFARLTEIINAIRLTLEPDLPRPADSHLILREGASYRFVASDQVEIDADLLAQRLNNAQRLERDGEIAAAIRAYEQATALYNGDYLPADRQVVWTANERAALQARYADALNRLADLYAHEGRLDMAIKAANTALEANAYAETTYRRLMRYHACKGDRKAAAAVYRTLVKLFSELFAEEINPITQQLYEDIEAGRPVSCAEVHSGTTESRSVTDSG
jgi:DNA-binding SARP family transcriptional activator